MGPEEVYSDISVTSNFANPQTNMVYYGLVYYHVFTALDGDRDIYLREEQRRPELGSTGTGER